MGEDPESIFRVGCPAMDIIKETDLNLGDLFEKFTGVGGTIDPALPYLVVLQHPVTTEYGRGLDQIRETLKAVESLKMQTVWLWPNVDAGSDDISKGLRKFREHNNPDYIRFNRNFPPEDFLKLISNCACLVGNSSSAIREGAFLGVPSVNIGTRQQGRERGANVIDVNHDKVEILNAIKRQLQHGPYSPSTIYGDGHAGERIANVLAQYEPRIQKRLYFVNGINGKKEQSHLFGGHPGTEGIQRTTPKEYSPPPGQTADHLYN
jgi:UDP-hydrolysing UDP-N-acetyl-D-glucosamine 2-epimerase